MVICKNSKALYKYSILEKVEAGLVLLGPEVKSLRTGRASIAEAFARARDGEVVLYNMEIPRYAPAAHMNVEPKRPRRLLLKKSQIAHLEAKVAQKGCTLVPLSLYFEHGFAKVELALAKGKTLFDKRETIKKRETQRELDRAKRRHV